MALRGASTTVDSDYIDWATLAAENAAVVCTLLAREEPRDYGNGEVEALKLHIVALTGKQAGTVWPAERVLKAGVRAKFNGCDIGDSVVGRVDVYGVRKAVGLQAERDGDVALAEAALAKFGAADVPAQRKKAPSKVVESDEGDDEPPF